MAVACPLLSGAHCSGAANTGQPATSTKDPADERKVRQAGRGIPALFASVRSRPYSRAFQNRLLREIGVAAGVPLSARRLRHACGVRIARKSRDLWTVCAWLNCSKAVAAECLRVRSANDPRMLELAE